MRRRLLWVHRWLGILLGVYFVMLGITGSLLVFAREIDRALNPELLTAPPQGEYQPLSAIVDTFRREYPDLPMSYVNYPLPPNGVFNIRSGPNQASQPYVYINPYTAEVIGDRTRIGSFYGFLMYLHFYLFIGQVGWTLNGWGRCCSPSCCWWACGSGGRHGGPGPRFGRAGSPFGPMPESRGCSMTCIMS